MRFRSAAAALALLASAACGPLASIQGDAAPGDSASADAAPEASLPPVCGTRDPAQANTLGIYDPYFDATKCSPETAITAPNEAWTWVPFEDATCGDGSPTGIGVNLTNRSTDVVIYLQGGGACWDQLTCFAVSSAANFETGYGAGDFDAESTRNAAWFRRTDALNPFKDASFVYVPYCTGDAHGGRRVSTIYYQGMARPVFFTGARNYEVFLRRLVPTFRNARRVWLVGISAGGFGAGLQWQRTQGAFGNAVRVDLIDDSGPPLQPAAGKVQLWANTWGLELPAGCATCATQLPDLIQYYAGLFTNQRFALLSYDQDQTISSFFGVPQTTFQASLSALRTRYAGEARFRSYVLSGTSHVTLGRWTTAGPNGQPNVRDWIRQMATDDPAWASTGP